MTRLLDLLPLLWLGVAAGLYATNRSLLRMARLGHRREEVLLRSLVTYDELLRRAVTGTLDEDELRLGVQLVETGLEDEMHAQAQVRWWQRIPPTGEPWPDELLGSVLGDRP